MASGKQKHRDISGMGSNHFMGKKIGVMGVILISFFKSGVHFAVRWILMFLGLKNGPSKSWFMHANEWDMGQFSWPTINCGSRGGRTGDQDPPPGKSQVIWVSIGDKQLDPSWKKLDPPPPRKCWTPLEPWKMIVFFEINHLTSAK